MTRHDISCALLNGGILMTLVACACVYRAKYQQEWWPAAAFRVLACFDAE